MPTINQLIRKPRKKAAKKSKSPALGSIVNTLKTKRYEKAAPLKTQPICTSQESDLICLPCGLKCSSR